jgi:hypothetical protein
MLLKTVTSLAFATACLATVGTLPAAHAQTAYGPAGDPGGNSVGLPGPNPGGPGLTPYTGGGGYPGYPTAPGTYGATQPYPSYPPAPSAGTGDTDVVTNGPQGSPPPNWSARQNVQQSDHYTWLLQHNRAFREARERRECGPITDAQLHQQCLVSFAEYSPWAGSAPAYGSSSSNRNYSSRSGR